ncbi:methylated-DNA--[protein]-cysteine S-methyltransferase [Erysipelothrix sp. strain 2 (EsS2-6-Brazil)]|uniref:methylated-DNA--[protein]-cysteine S-methyltransferase n=1 Tax=Erysipelothrix sp. strain 2 (EsS2-6-Brazil) TaxID=2500549 RepID=UPI001378F9BE|nr:methylated-DNA--[protein]-cysteine S-methyltransferase [Erysipelothrix sp. strain 2 (EsS2-6-Brazil)]MBK2402419.1 methylated-DNA--[protein]-cysteine S-methyltransferase [Erysipelothrix sp. strain 2 (EsS2-6-Brazil)]NBA00725.1 methylated-DNA--[protein]-cysteine S-methyltransferase [Erysipelothrix rhusiopathiae]
MIGRICNIQGHDYLIVEHQDNIVFLSTAEDLDFFKRKFKVDYLELDMQACEEVVEQLNEYLSGERTCFDFRYQLIGTSFQCQVWEGLQSIPYGSTISYEALSDMLFTTRKTRAVARAVSQNPLLLCVPCHRVIGKNGALTGFRGGLTLKQTLLKLEKDID